MRIEELLNLILLISSFFFVHFPTSNHRPKFISRNLINFMIEVSFHQISWLRISIMHCYLSFSYQVSILEINEDISNFCVNPVLNSVNHVLGVNQIEHILYCLQILSDKATPKQVIHFALWCSSFTLTVYKTCALPINEELCI